MVNLLDFLVFQVVSHSGLSVISSSSKPVDSSKHRWNLNPTQFPMTISAVVWIIISPKKQTNKNTITYKYWYFVTKIVLTYCEKEVF